MEIAANMSQTKTEKSHSSHELWLAIRELYKWRHGANLSWTGRVFDSLLRGEDVIFITANSPILREAFEMWREHPSEENFWKIHFIRPDLPDEIA